MRLTVDASIFVASSKTTEEQNLPSMEFLKVLEKSHDTEVFCPTLILVECAAAISRRTLDPSFAEGLVDLVKTFPGMQLISLDAGMAQRAAEIAILCRLRGADSVYAATAEAFDAVLIAWDVEMIQRSSSVVKSMTPVQWMKERQ